MKGTIPPGVSVPLHSHPDDESFSTSLACVQALVPRQDAFGWITMHAGDFRHVPQEVRHAWKNQSNEPAVVIIVTTSRLGRFFRKSEDQLLLTRFQSLHLSRTFSVSPRSLLATTTGSPARRTTLQSASAIVAIIVGTPAGNWTGYTFMISASLCLR